MRLDGLASTQEICDTACPAGDESLPSDTLDRPSPPVRKRDAERTRTALLASGLKEFAQNGFMGARLEKIATGAKCNIRMLYHYFGGKKGLYLAVLEAAYADLRHRESLIEIDPAKPLEGILELTRFTVLYFQSHPLFEGLLRAENMMQGRFVSQLQPVPQGGSTLKTLIGRLIHNGQAQGLFRPDLDPVQVYVTITALSRFHLANAYSMSAVLETDLRDPDWRADRLRHSLEVIAAYVQAKPA